MRITIVVVMVLMRRIFNKENIRIQKKMWKRRIRMVLLLLFCCQKRSSAASDYCIYGKKWLWVLKSNISRECTTDWRLFSKCSVIKWVRFIFDFRRLRINAYEEKKQHCPIEEKTNTKTYCEYVMTGFIDARIPANIW